MVNRTRVLMVIMLLVIVVLGGIVAYNFLLKPAVSGYATQRQVEGAQIAINAILMQIQQNGYVQIPISENQSLILVPYVPSQQQAPIQ